MGHLHGGAVVPKASAGVWDHHVLRRCGRRRSHRLPAWLFINGDPAGFLIGPQREFCRAWPNQQEVTEGAHFLPEDSPAEVGDAIARFVAKVLARQLASDLLPQPAC